MARPTVRTISRYLLRQHCAPLGFALAALTSLMLLNQIAKQFGSLVGKGLPWSVILEVFVLSVPFIVAVTLPMAVLVAVLHVFTRRPRFVPHAGGWRYPCRQSDRSHRGRPHVLPHQPDAGCRHRQHTGAHRARHLQERPRDVDLRDARHGGPGPS